MKHLESFIYSQYFGLSQKIVSIEAEFSDIEDEIETLVSQSKYNEENLHELINYENSKITEIQELKTELEYLSTQIGYL